MGRLSPKGKANRQRLKDDLQHYSKRCLKIRTKAATIEPLLLNEAQLHIHAKVEAQKEFTGRVRALLLKGRQQGGSTYVQARYYHQVTHRKGLRAFILTHLDDATKNIFGMADRFHKNCPKKVRPSTGAANAKELFFDKLDSGYQVGTAGAKGVGRSATIQYFHGSEVAYWPNAKTHLSGIMQAIPDGPGTEIILESTSNGAVGEFYRMCKEANEGKGDYQLIFIPWFWQKEYCRPAVKVLKLTSDEEALQKAHGLTVGQLAWRRAKIVDLGSVYEFRREYPCTIEEAFAMEREGALWSREDLDETRVVHCPELVRKVVGVDPPGGVHTECGIVVAGLSRSKELYYLDDRSTAGLPEKWGARIISAFIDNDCSAIVYESNYGGRMVASVIKAAWEVKFNNTHAPLIAVSANKSKEARAEPISLMWTELGGRSAHIVGHLDALEDEFTTWEPNSGMDSPNRLDAGVHAGAVLLKNAAVGTPSMGQPTGGGWG